MENGSGLGNSAVTPLLLDPPRLLVELPPGYKVFFGNLFDHLSLRNEPALEITSMPASFWSDVFVNRGLPWPEIIQSMVLHLLFLSAVWSLSQAWLSNLKPPPPLTVSRKEEVIYFSPSEYLPPLDTGSAPAKHAQKGDPEFAKQPIISVPPEPDNRSQTIVTPPNIKLTHDVAVPNIVAWNSALPSVPLPASNRTRLTPEAASVVAPPPDVNRPLDRRTADLPQNSVIAPPPDAAQVLSPRTPSAPQADIVGPPPAMDNSIRAMHDINIGRSEVVAPAPQLPLGAQRAVSAQSLVHSAAGTQVVAPPPSLQGTGTAGGGGRIIALGIHPAAGPPPKDLGGNRQGSFAATPSGKAGAAGTPYIAADSRGAGNGGHGRGNSGGAGSGSSGTPGLPPGVFVGSRPKDAGAAIAGSGSSGVSGGGGASEAASGKSADPALMADARPPRVSTQPRRALEATSKPTELERQVFGDRKFYSMLLNMPNLNSLGGSWVIRFAELKTDEDKSELTAPDPIHKVDPAYPLELMKAQIEGTVTLYAVIHSDGKVGDVRVLSSPDERLDEYARSALTSWRFRPATKGGNPVALEAVVMIPFRARRAF